MFDLNDLRKLHEAATKGPLKHDGDSGDGKRQFITSDMNRDNWNCLSAEVSSDDCDYDMAIANTKFIVELYNAFPEIIARLERSAEFEAALTQIIAAYSQYGSDSQCVKLARKALENA